MKYVIELSPHCWIADWEGDPGRTLKIESAKTFDNQSDALHHLEILKVENPYRSFQHAKIERIN